MGDSNNDGNVKTASFKLPPGCRFYPSEEQLLCYYLPNKNKNADETGNFYGYNLIKELDLYEYEPHELPEKACYAYGRGGRKRHWYCYSKIRVRKGSRSRRTKNGYWKKTGSVRQVVINNCNNKGGKVVLGTKTSFVFYSGNSPETAVRTDWVMYEYALSDHIKTSFVLCRVFVKSHGGNSVSEIGLSSVAEESVSAVRHIGVQHDGFLSPDIAEAKVHDDNSVDRKSDTVRRPVRLVSQPGDHVSSGPVSNTNFQFSAGITPSEQVCISGLTSGGMVIDSVRTQQLLSILEEDFIELEDLVP